jgi:hypothetical protein
VRVLTTFVRIKDLIHNNIGTVDLELSEFLNEAFRFIERKKFGDTHTNERCQILSVFIKSKATYYYKS